MSPSNAVNARWTRHLGGVTSIHTSNYGKLRFTVSSDTPFTRGGRGTWVAKVISPSEQKVVDRLGKFATVKLAKEAAENWAFENC